MSDLVLNHCYRALEITEEFEQHLTQKNHLLQELRDLSKSYHAGNIDYASYEQRRGKLLGQRTPKEWKTFYSTCLLTLLKRISFFNQQVFYHTIADNPFSNAPPRAPAAPERGTAPQKPVKRERPRVKRAPVKKKSKVTPPKQITADKIQKEHIKELTSVSKGRKPLPVKKKEEPQKEKEAEVNANSFEELFTQLED